MDRLTSAVWLAKISNLGPEIGEENRSEIE